MPKAAKTTIVKISDKEILVKRYWSNGQLKFEGSYYEMPNELVGKENGTEIKPKEYETRGDGNNNGLATWWYENGQIKSEINYKNRNRDGKWSSWLENGQIKSKINYKEGKKAGKFTYWDENGQIKSEKYYKNGK